MNRPGKTSSVDSELSSGGAQCLGDDSSVELCPRSAKSGHGHRDVAARLLQLAALSLLFMLLLVGGSITLLRPTGLSRPVLQRHVASAFHQRLRLAPLSAPTEYMALLSLDLTDASQRDGDDDDTLGFSAQQNAADVVVVQLPHEAAAAASVVSVLRRALPRHDGHIGPSRPDTSIGPVTSATVEEKTRGRVFFREDVWRRLEHGVARVRTQHDKTVDVLWVRLQRHQAQLHSTNATILIVCVTTDHGSLEPTTAGAATPLALRSLLQQRQANQPATVQVSQLPATVEEPVVLTGDIADLLPVATTPLGLADPMARFHSPPSLPSRVLASKSLRTVSASLLQDTTATVVVYEM